MNWIDFKKERPKEEPKRGVLFWQNDELHVAMSDCINDWPEQATHWSEIEPPPKPDPFEVWWAKAEKNLRKYVMTLHGRTIWDAAIKHAKGSL